MAESAAQTLYGPAPEPPPVLGVTPTPAAAPAGAPPSTQKAIPSTTEKIAEALYGQKPPEVVIPVPKNIADLREADQNRKLYSPQNAYADALPNNLFDNAEGASDAQKAAAVAELREMAHDVGYQLQDVREFMILMNQPPPDAKTVEAWKAEAAKRLGEVYGAGASKALAAAQALVARDPRVAYELQATGLGNHPDVILKFARLGLINRR